MNKLKKKSLNNYFQERYIGGCKSTYFWNTIKPYLSRKSCNSQSKIILMEEENTVNINEEVAEMFNGFFL